MKIQFRASFKRDLKKINDKEVLRLIKKEVKKLSQQRQYVRLAI